MAVFTIVSQTYGSHQVLYDDEDEHLVFQYTWRLKYEKKNGVFYAVTNIGRTVKGNLKTITLHRLLTGVADPKIHVDHKNHNGLDNRRENLRPCTRIQNLGNIRTRKKYKGIVHHKDKDHAKKPWEAQITIDGKSRYLGCYTTEKEAALAYNKAAEEKYGEFALLNVID